MIKIVRGEMVKDGRWRRTVGGGGTLSTRDYMGGSARRCRIYKTVGILRVEV